MSLLKDHRPCLCHIGWTEAAVTHARKGHANRRKIQLDASKLVDILPQCRIGSEADVNPIPEGSLSTIFGIHASKINFSAIAKCLSHSKPWKRPRKNTKSGKNDLSPTKTLQGDLFSRRNQLSRPCIVSAAQMAIRPSIIKFAIKSPSRIFSPSSSS